MIVEIVRPLGVELLLEPGRSIIAPAGVLLSRCDLFQEKFESRL